MQLEDRFQMLEVDVTHPLLGAKALPAQHNGDSGYLSTVGDNGEPSKASAGLLLQTVEAHLKPYLGTYRPMLRCVLFIHLIFPLTFG